MQERKNETLKVMKISNDIIEEKKTCVLRECHFDLYVNDSFCTAFTCSVEFIEELVIGYLYSSRKIQSFTQILKIIYDAKNCVAHVTCQTISSTEAVFLNQIANDLSYEKIVSYAKYFYKIANKELVRGAHHAAVFYNDTLQHYASDIGRHNAIDKVIGLCVKNNVCLSECVLISTGRAPLDIVKKVMNAGVKVLLSRSVPTYEAVKYSRKYNLTLIGGIEKDYKCITRYS